MNGFIDKLISSLEAEATAYRNDSDKEYKQGAYEQAKEDMIASVCLRRAIQIVNQLAEEYSNGWISCSERLPEEELKKAREERGKEAVFPVLATINKVHLISGEKYKIVSRAFYGCYDDKNFYNACCDKLDVIAWKPLDAPFQPKGE